MSIQANNIPADKLCALAASNARLNRFTENLPVRFVKADIKAACASINRTYEAVEKRFAAAVSVPEACEWLLDNRYLALREAQNAAADLSKQRQLRAGNEGVIILSLCSALLTATDCRVTEDDARVFLEGFQSVSVLPRRELYLFPAAMRAALIIRLGKLCAELKKTASPEDFAADMAAVFTSLRLVSELDMQPLLEQVDMAEKALMADPAGIYPRMDDQSRALYRERLSAIAKRSALEEHSMANHILRQCRQAKGEARHVGWHLFPETADRSRGGPYIAANLLLTLFLSLLCGFLSHSVAAALLLLLPISELTKSLLDYIILLIVPPRRLPRLELRGGIPDEGKTVCVISALLSGTDSGAKLAKRLEAFYLSNRRCGKNLFFGILADLPEADLAVTDSDAELISSAAGAIDALNSKYGGGFYLFTRPRTKDTGRGKFSGRERKRGAVLALAELLLGENTELRVSAGSRKSLDGTKFILTLDSDTSPAPDSIAELVGAMLHPLNKPVLDREKGLVVSGHGIIHPRMCTQLRSAGATDFSRVFSGPGGSEPYSAICGEVYMDLFDRGGFFGKGIIDAESLVVCSRAHIPEGRVLSHDALEGAYLRGGYMSDTEFSDSFPSSPLAYYRRSHRWIRGDWQNAAWIFRHGSAMPDIERWRLFDSLRRSLVAPATFTAIFLGLLFAEKGLILAAWAAVLALAVGFLIALTEFGTNRTADLELRYHSRLIKGITAALIQALLRLWFLPYEAWISVSAAAAALWRQLVSRKNLLEWETAAQSERKKAGAVSYYRNMWLTPVSGAILLIFSAGIFAKAVGLLWILAPLAALALALPAGKNSELSRDDRQYLLSCAEDIWSYFDFFCTEEDNFLPPDNYQEQPPVGIAHRTSPTNMGLALVSALCASLLGADKDGRALEIIEKMLGTMERLPKYGGHFCNWYDTRTLRPLEPKYLSTVDCGNLCACLIALKNGLLKADRPQLAGRVSALLEPMDFSIFYNENRGLFHIGIDLEKGAASPGLYDLMASEARLTSYLAVAKGDVPRRHWRSLSRAMRSSGGYQGMASWTGTMFEYLMPELFLPLAPDSLLYETAKYCMYVQKRRKSRSGLWGISESAFFSLDPALNYRYKAHGCADLALKRGQDRELVIAPYASFLALLVEPKAAIANLRCLEAEGAIGRFGFIEAIDFTPARCRTAGGERVRCYMAHHLGMSMLAIADCVENGAVQDMFMSEPAMGAYTALLEEKVPTSSSVLKLTEAESEKPRKPSNLQWEKRGSQLCFENPECTLLSNGIYNIMLTETGISSASCADTLVYKAPFRQLGEGHGPELWLEMGEKRLSLLPEPDDSSAFMWEFSEISCTFSRVTETFTSRCTIAAGGGENGELRIIELSAKQDIEAASLNFSFEPVLANADDYVNHPAYWRLGLELRRDGNCLLLHRLPRGRQKEAWLCLACDRPMRSMAERHGNEGGIAEPFVTAAADISMKAGERCTLRFALCVGAVLEEAYAGAQHMLAIGPSEYGAMVSACASLTHMDAREVDAAMGLVGHLWFIRAAQPFPAKQRLWQYGISGDLPIICCESAEEAETLTRQFCLIRSCGVCADLVFLTDEGGEYYRPVYGKVRDTLATHGLEAFIGTHGGVRLLPTEAADVIKSAAAYTVGEDKPERDCGAVYNLPEAPVRKLGSVPKYEYAGDGSFVFYVNRALPSRAWSSILTNGSFGYIAADCGMGNMWYKNARELKLTRWDNAPSAAVGPESLEYIFSKGRYSIFAADDGVPCRVRFGFGYAVWEKSFGSSGTRCTCFIPQGIDARVFILELCGQVSGRIAWKCEPLLSDNDNDYVSVNIDYVNSFFVARSSRSPIGGLAFRAVCSAPALGWTGDYFSWLRGEFDAKSENLSYPVFAAAYDAQPVMVIACGCCEEKSLIELCKPENAFAALDATKAYWRDIVTRFTLSGAGLPDRYMSGWGVYQALACRLMGRCSLYQSGGATGFRDQLQDAVNLILIDSQLAKEEILLCCEHQYLEGDVMHWWHSISGSDKGVRTRCSDDLLWLVWALCEYTEKTGDLTICSELVYYVNSKPLDVHEHDRYETPVRSSCAETVLQHAKRAIDCCIGRGTGPNGLLRFGGGDWNDGMDKVGGESSWLTWFFANCVRRYADLLVALCKPDADEYRSLAAECGKAADRAWDGAWYLRGYWPDGEALGSRTGECCRIDSVVQSWAAFCADASNSKADLALDSALRLLYDRDNRLIKLFTPPFYGAGRDPGYIRSYGAGFRENGGQYTHAAIWLAMACFRRGRPRDGCDILRDLLPEAHEGRAYMAEPFVIAADVYSAAGHVGEAGWTWYTGSAGWYFRVCTEELLGLRLWHGRLYIRPCLPDDFPECRVSLRSPGGREYDIFISSEEIRLDGEKYDGKGIPYV